MHDRLIIVLFFESCPPIHPQMCRSILKQYLDGISVNDDVLNNPINPLMVVNNRLQASAMIVAAAATATCSCMSPDILSNCNDMRSQQPLISFDHCTIHHVHLQITLAERNKARQQARAQQSQPQLVMVNARAGGAQQ